MKTIYKENGTRPKWYLTQADNELIKETLFRKGITFADFCRQNNISYSNAINVLRGKTALGVSLYKKLIVGLGLQDEINWGIKKRK